MMVLYLLVRRVLSQTSAEQILQLFSFFCLSVYLEGFGRRFCLVALVLYGPRVGKVSAAATAKILELRILAIH
jgi:hypothetical protein